MYVQCINKSGVVQWATNGINVSTAASELNHAITSDGDDGAIITWGDTRGGGDIYAQRVNSSGTMLWGTNGLCICNATQYQAFPAVYMVGSLSAGIAWQDYRNGNDDIYYQQVQLNGTCFLPLNGYPACTEPSAQTNPMMVNVGGSQYPAVLWEDARSGDVDIYANRVVLRSPPYVADRDGNLAVSVGQSVSISWTLADNTGGGTYRILVNDSAGAVSSYVSNVPVVVSVSTAIACQLNYTIEYSDTYGLEGMPNTILVTVQAQSPGGVPGYSIEIMMLSMSCALLAVVYSLRKKCHGSMVRLG